MAIIRKIIKIDEEKCNGCGLCVPACAEGAVQIINGKARLVSENFCDGLGACLGDCPTGAITIEERKAENFDRAAVEQHLARLEQEKNQQHKTEPGSTGQGFQGCPGSLSMMLAVEDSASGNRDESESAPVRSELGNWPVQLKLAPLSAPYFHGADLLISADCVPFAYGDFHGEFLAGKTVLIGCPKLDDSAFYREKLGEIFKRNRISSIEVLIMEVPCCFALAGLVSEAVQDSGKDIPVTITKIGVRGEVLEKRTSSVF